MIYVHVVRAFKKMWCVLIVWMVFLTRNPVYGVMFESRHRQRDFLVEYTSPHASVVGIKARVPATNAVLPTEYVYYDGWSQSMLVGPFGEQNEANTPIRIPISVLNTSCISNIEGISRVWLTEACPHYIKASKASISEQELETRHQAVLVLGNTSMPHYLNYKCGYYETYYDLDLGHFQLRLLCSDILPSSGNLSVLNAEKLSLSVDYQHGNMTVYASTQKRDILFSTLMTVLIFLFLASWIVLSKDLRFDTILNGVYYGSNADASVNFDYFWSQVSSVGPVILDATLLIVYFSIVMALEDTQALVSEDAIRAAGEPTVNALSAAFQYAIGPILFLVTSLGILYAYGTQDSYTDQSVNQARNYVTKIFLKGNLAVRLGLLISAAGALTITVFITSFYLGYKWVTVYAIVSISVVICAMILGEEYAPKLAKIVDETFSSIPMAIAFRLCLEVLLLLSLQAIFPTEINGKPAPNFKNGVGLGVGLVTCVITGRDGSMLIKIIVSGTKSTINKICVILIILGGIAWIVAHTSVFMLSPVFISSTALKRYPEMAFELAVSFGLQLCSMSGIASVVYITPIGLLSGKAYHAGDGSGSKRSSFSGPRMEGINTFDL